MTLSSLKLLQKSAARDLYATSVATSVESVCKRIPTNSDSLRLIGKREAFRKLFGRLEYVLFASLPVSENRFSAGRIHGDMIDFGEDAVRLPLDRSIASKVATKLAICLSVKVDLYKVRFLFCVA